MRLFTQSISVLVALGATLLFSIGCGGSSGSGGGDVPGNASGSVSVTMVDGPTTDYRAINLNIQSVQIHQSSSPGDAGWITLSSPNKTLNLLSLQGGIVEVLATKSTVGVGTYQMLRLVLGAGNTVTLADGTIAPLTVPSGQQSGIKIPLNFTVVAGTTADVWIDFDGAHSIHMTSTGSGSYMLRPVVHGYMQTTTGSVSGTLTGPTGQPLAGAVILAESLDGSGNVTILRTTTSSATGTYSLNLLPISQPFYIVSQPVIGSTIYNAKASGLITLTTAAAVVTANLTFSLALGSGSVGGVLTPVATASQSDTVYLMQSIPTGPSGTALLVVGSTNAVIGTTETYSLLLVPAGSYKAQGLRSTLNADGTTTVVRTVASSSFAVTAGVTTTQEITF